MEAGLHTDLPKFLNRRGSKIKILPSIHLSKIELFTKFEGPSLKNEPTASLRSLKSTEEDLNYYFKSLLAKLLCCKGYQNDRK